MAIIPFFKKLSIPKFLFSYLGGKPERVVGIDIGTYSTKVVQLRYEKERAILETYGELINYEYLKKTEIASAFGFLRYSDKDIGNLLKDTLKESNVTARDAIVAIPSGSSFTTVISLPMVPKKEIYRAIPYEARKYIPIPISEVSLDWEIVELDTENNTYKILIVAVPNEVISKFKRVIENVNIRLRALEIEMFSLIRSLIGHDPTPTAIINLGHLSACMIVTDRAQLRLSRNFTRGSREISRMLEKGLGVSFERADAIKRDVGLSEEMENKEISSVMYPAIETLMNEIERNISLYNRKAARKIQKINLTGGGSNLKGIVEYTSSKFGIEVTRGNPFSRVVSPAFMQPILREIGPSLSVATGLALREITIK